MVYTYEEYVVFRERVFCFVYFSMFIFHFLHESDTGVLEHFCNLKMYSL